MNGAINKKKITERREQRARGKRLFAFFRKYLAEEALATDDLQMVVVHGIMRGIDSNKWRSLLFNMRRNEALLTMPPKQLIDTLIRDPCELATEEVKRERQRVIEEYRQRSMPSDEGFSLCDACGEKKLVVQFVRRPTGQGRKCEDVCMKRCTNCSFRQ